MAADQWMAWSVQRHANTVPDLDGSKSVLTISFKSDGIDRL